MPIPLSDPDKEQFAKIVQGVTKRRNAPAPGDDDIDLLLKLLAERDEALAYTIGLVGQDEIEGER